MSSFHDVRLPEDVERGARGGPRFKTTVLVLSAGHEKRNIEWDQSRGEWDIGYGIENKEDYNEVIKFFMARRGMAYSFRFKDWSDYQIGEDNPVQIGTGDGTTVNFQIQKPYVSGAVTFWRTIEKIVPNTLTVWVNDVLQTETTHYTVNLLTGQIAFLSAPTDTHSVKISCEFDVPVRFATDSLDIQLETFDAGQIPQIPVIEVKGE